MPDPTDLDVLQQQPPEWRLGPRGKAVLAGLVIALAVGIFYDRRARETERAALDACAARIESSTVAALGPVSAMANYVRVTRAGANPALREELELMVSEKTVGAEPRLQAVHSQCDQVAVWSHHWALRDRRESCLARLTEFTASIRSVGEDGAAYFRGEVSVLATPVC